MGEIPESNEPKDPAKEARAKELYTTFMNDAWEVWAKHQRAEKILKPDEVYRTMAQALMSMAAVAAVDVGINDVQFIGMAKLTWDTAYKAAPKFN